MIRTVQNSFVSGEISPALYGRHDLKAYFNGAARIQDMVVRKTGGVRKRQGTDLLMDLSAYPGCRLVPFFYDRTACVLLLFHGGKCRFIGRNAAGNYDFLKYYSGAPGSSGYYLFGTGESWVVYTVDTQYANADLPFLKYYQSGDTVFLTCPGYQACKMQRQANLSWTIEYMTGTVTVPTPATLTATPSGFHDESTAYPASTVDYALFAMKGGVISPPRKASAAITVPWISGAQVALSFTPDLSAGIDGYYLGKKSGAYYGMLAEFWPTREPVDLTSKTYATSGVSTADWAAYWKLSSAHATDLREADPNATARTEIKMFVSKYAVHVPKNASGVASAEFYRSTSFNVGTVRLFWSARTADAVRQNAVSPDYTAAKPTVKIELQVGGVWVTDYDGPAYAAEGVGYEEFTVSNTSSMTRMRVSISLGSVEETGALLRGIAILNRSGAYVTSGSWTLYSSATSYTVRGVSGVTSSATYYLAAYLDVNSDSEGDDRDTLEEESCTPARYLKPHKTPCALALYDSGSGVMAGKVTLAAAAHYPIDEIRIYPGALCAGLPLHTPGTLVANKSNTAGCKILYTLDGSTWAKLDGTFAIADQYSVNPVSIAIPAGTSESITGAAVGWGVEFIAADATKPVLVRGVQFYTTKIVSKFIDQNHTPGALIDAQTYIKPGSSDMDVETLGIWQQRLVLGASAGYPFTLWFSKVGDLSNWYANRPQTDADAFSVSIPATKASRILSLLADRSLIVLTESGEYVVDALGNEGFGYSTCRIQKVSGVGACAVDPVGVQSTALFVAADGRTLTELRYDLGQDGLVPIDRSVLATHLTERSNVARLAWQSAPDGTLWVLLKDGTLLSFTYLPEHEVFAWSRHAYAGGRAVVLDVVAPGSIDETLTDCEGCGDVFLLVQLPSGSLALEKMRAPIAADAPSIESSLSLDRMVTVNGVGSEYLYVGAIYTDGDTLTAVNLDSGEVRTGTANGNAVILTGSGASGRWAVGYAVGAQLQTLRPEMPERNVQAMSKNIVDAVLRVNRARGLSVTSSSGTSDGTKDAAFSAAGVAPLYSGDVKIVPRGCWNDDGQMLVDCAGPWPCELQSVIFKMEIESR